MHDFTSTVAFVFQGQDSLNALTFAYILPWSCCMSLFVSSQDMFTAILGIPLTGIPDRDAKVHMIAVNQHEPSSKPTRTRSAHRAPASALALALALIRLLVPRPRERPRKKGTPIRCVQSRPSTHIPLPTRPFVYPIHKDQRETPTPMICTPISTAHSPQWFYIPTHHRTTPIRRTVLCHLNQFGL